MPATPIIDLANTLAEQGQHGPAAVWRHFYTLSTTPRQSKQEDGLRRTLSEWARDHGIATEVDAAGNLILRKPAAKGCEGAPGVILQGHLDMVCQANAGCPHDFSRDPITVELQEGWLVAPQTTLGADNGIGVALALAVLEQNDLRHGPLEVLLTVDEEDGMGGAQGLRADALNGRFLLNLDTEEWGEFYIGCAGGLDVNVSRPLPRVPVPAGQQAFRLIVDGLVGGHSGCDIHTGRGNANKLLVRALRKLEKTVGVRVMALAGGSARNAIPREAWAQVALADDKVATAQAVVARLAALYAAELAGVDAGVRLVLQAVPFPAEASVLDAQVQSAVLAALHAAPVGVRRMSTAVPGVVETSNNLGTVSIDNEGLRANLMVRSLVDSAAEALGDELASLFALAACELDLSGHYPGWRPNADSPLLARCRAVYARDFAARFGESRVQVIHAGLECGIIGGTYPALDMVSFGPTIRGAHAPGERVEVASVGQCWQLLRAILHELTINP